MSRVLHAIGIMTGNSMDGVDLVLTRFDDLGGIQDLYTLSRLFPRELADKIRKFRAALNEENADVAKAEQRCIREYGLDVAAVHDEYLSLVAEVVRDALSEIATARILTPPHTVDLLGFHGQTCGHCPPSIARLSGVVPYTIQMGDGQKLADLTGITVVNDFRSDDVMSGGEGAPLAPMHHQHLAESTKRRGAFPIAFLNSGNTGNISVISIEEVSGETTVLGWDTGPFNHFPDLLARQESDLTFDKDGRIGKEGQVDLNLLGFLFNNAAVTSGGSNFFLLPPPRSSDPQWYRELPELFGGESPGSKKLALADRMRTAEYLSAYGVMHSLTLLSERVKMPTHFAFCGGGWRNPLVASHFAGLLQGDFTGNPVLPGHRAAFDRVLERLGGRAECHDSSHYGFDGAAMEARLFADAAVSRVKAEPFTVPSITGVTSPCICGVLRFPKQDTMNATPALKAVLETFGSTVIAGQQMGGRDSRFGRAIPGWQAP